MKGHIFNVLYIIGKTKLYAQEILTSFDPELPDPGIANTNVSTIQCSVASILPEDMFLIVILIMVQSWEQVLFYPQTIA